MYKPTRNIGAKDKYQQHLSCQRLRNVQSLLGQNEGGNARCDAILSVLGVDSKFNEGCREFANYLTLGFFSNQRRLIEDAKLEEEDVEDVIILVRSNSVAVFCNPCLYLFLLPYIACWRNVQIYCKSLEANGKRDTFSEEAYKVKSFISMVRGCENIGIPYLGSQFSKSLDRGSKLEFSIESWPLIQSFCEVDIGCGEPFKTCHTTIDVRNKLIPLYNQCSPFVLGKVVKNSYPLFKRHWDEALSVMNNAMKGKTPQQLNEEQVCEPLLSYFKHGNLIKLSRQAKPNIDHGRKPCVLFGAHTVDYGKETKSTNLKSSARKSQQMVTHVVMQSVSPNEPMLCARTYFIRPEEKSGPAVKEFNDLVHLYTVCTQGCNLAIEEFTLTLDISQAESKGAGHLLAKGLSTGLVFDAKCTITACDKVGKKVNVPGGSVVPYVYNITIGVENVKTSHGGELIGSVIFAETFVVSSFHLEGNDAESSRNTICNLVTSDIPVYKEWRAGPVQTHHDGGNEAMAILKDATVCSASSLYSPPTYANFQFNEDGGMILSSNGMDDVCLKSGVQYFDSPNPGEVCIILINFDIAENAQQWECVPPNFRGDISIIPDVALAQSNKCLVLGLVPGTQAYKEFYAVVVHHIQNDFQSNLSIKRAKSVSEDVLKLYKTLQNTHQTRKAILKSTFSKDAISFENSYDYFMSHLTLSTISHDFTVPEAVMGAVLQKSYQSKDEVDDDIIPVSIICGHPSSGADGIGSQLVNLNKERVRWVIIRPTLNDEGAVNGKLMEEQLSQAVQNKRVSRPSAAARKKLRILIVATGFFDLCEIIQCVMFHSESSVREQLPIGAVTVCVNPKAIHMVERENYPKFFDQCLQGVVNNFAFIIEDIEMPSILDKTLVEAQSLVRNVNKQAAFIICPDSKLVRKNDFDMILAEDSFRQPKCLAERFLLRPELNAGRYLSVPSVPNISKIKVEFSQPLLKGTFCARLRGLKTSVTSPQPYGSICFVSGCVAFTDEPKQDFSLSFCSDTKQMDLIQRDSMLNQPAPPSKTSPQRSKAYYLDFYGIDMNHDELKDWLRKCGRQKPSKKSHKTKSRLTKAEIDTIHEDNCTRNLPEGYFYNGSFYVSLFDNKKLLRHPYMSQFIDEYLAVENDEIDAFNAAVDRQNIKDIFD